MNKEILQSIGLTPSETDVYLTLLKIGNTSTGALITQAKVSRSKVYDVLERLKQKGFVTEMTKENVRYFEATDPSNIIDYLKTKKEDIDKKINETQKIIPELRKFQKDNLEKQEAKVYTGIEGWKTAYNEILNDLADGGEYLAFGLGKVEAQNEFVRTFIKKFHLKRADSGAKARVLLRRETKEYIDVNFPITMKGTKIRYTDMRNPTNIAMWNDKVLTLVWGENPVAFVIKSKQVAGKYREYFEYLWKESKP